MIEKILNLNNIEKLKNKVLEKLYQDLQGIGFFSEATGKDCSPQYYHDKQTFTCLKQAPNPEDGINEQNYIREEWVNKNGRVVYARIYDFDLKIISTCS